jgi:hypothetical protein
MKIVSEAQLVETVRSLCDNVTKRLWIASPYVGNWTAVRRIIGREWADNGTIDVRLLTDISENGNINPNTFKCFRDRGEIKTITGLHAKIYIIDDLAVVSSANLTGTAFSKRYEVGVFLTNREATSIIELYRDWWNKVAKDILPDEIPRIDRHRTSKEKEETLGEGLPTRWVLPADPGNPISELIPKFRDYEDFLRCYHDFAQEYSKVQRLWPDTPLFFETDAFLNYLFHEHEDKPSHEYKGGKPRILDTAGRKREIRKYALLFKNWLFNDPDGIETTPWRQEGSKRIRELLSKEKIENLNREEIKQVVGTLNCMKSVALTRSIFLNPSNNDTKTICNAWENLLYGIAPLQTRMSKCKKSLRNFGKSSIHELLGFFEPDKYPLRNKNSSAGLRFFGYNVSAY